MKRAGIMESLELARGRLIAAGMLGRALGRTLTDEIREGTLAGTLRQSFRGKTLSFAGDLTFPELLEKRTAENPFAVYIRFDAQKITRREVNCHADGIAHGLKSFGARPGENAAIICPNSPEFLYIFFGLQKMGMGVVPINTALVGDGLAFVINNSETKFLFVHEAHLPQVMAVRDQLPRLKEIILIMADEPTRKADSSAPRSLTTLDSFLISCCDRPFRGGPPDPDSVGLILYTSGTTGLPKGVIYRYRDSNVKLMRVLANLLYTPDDVLYTCLPLFHANALLMSSMQALNAGAQIALGARFSASRFWSEVAAYEATTFNTLGAMIPILLKQPPSGKDYQHRVKLVVSAACPAQSWRAFEKRFGVRLIEAYASVDGGGFLTLNMGNAPVGSIGKPLGGARYRLAAESGADAAPFEPGELVIATGGSNSRKVEYFRNDEATRQKTRDGWLHTGDLLYRDKRGFLYFVGRNTDSMRRRGENVSAYEVESVLSKHPDVLECAVFGVPSELGEHDIMAAVVPIEGRHPDPAAIRAFMEDKLAKYALPRYIDIVTELPKTETHRVQKNILKARGVTPQTWDAEIHGNTARRAV